MKPSSKKVSSKKVSFYVAKNFLDHTGNGVERESLELWERGRVWNGNGMSVERDEGNGMLELVELASCSTHLTFRSSVDETAQPGSRNCDFH